MKPRKRPSPDRTSEARCSKTRRLFQTGKNLSICEAKRRTYTTHHNTYKIQRKYQVKLSISDGDNVAPSSSTVVQSAFGGRSVTESRCDACGQKSERFDTFRELQLSFPNSDNQTTQSLINYYLQPEKMCGENQYHCDNCKRLTDGIRLTKVIEPPTRLILTLKQFRYDPVSQQRTKILQRVTLDELIQIENVQYELYASVVHYGSSVDSGHYYTFAKDDLEWYKFNDCSVFKSRTDELFSLEPPETPYILFYRRLELLDPAPLKIEDLPLRLQNVIFKDHSEAESDRFLKMASRPSFSRRNDDDPPPPGCGGGGLFPQNHNRFVC